MADAASIPGSVSSKLDCSVCHERFQHPKILECLHSFCEKCLVKSVTYGGLIICPVCNRKMKIPNESIENLKTNFHLIGKLQDVAVREQLSSQEFSLVCDSCELKNEAVSRCLDCSMYLCLSCQTVHRRIAVLSEHTVASLDDLRCGKFAKTFRRQRGVDECPKHHRYYCEICEGLICRECPQIDQERDPQMFCGSRGLNSKHNIIEMEPAASARRKTTKEMTAKLKKALPEFKSTLEKIAAAGPPFKNHAANLKKQVKEYAKKIRDKIAADELRLYVEIARICQEQEKLFQDSQKNLEAAIQSMSDSIETADDVADNASDWDFLELYSLINNDLNSVMNKRPTDIYDGFPLWTFQRQRLEPVGTLRRGAKVQKTPSLEEMKGIYAEKDEVLLVNFVERY